MCHCRAPGVQYRGDGDLGAEMLGVGGDRQHGLGVGLEQQAVDHPLVLVGNIGDCAWQGEDEVEVADGQQFGLAVGEPLPGRGTLTLRTVPVATRVVGDPGVIAVFADRDMAAECC